MAALCHLCNRWPCLKDDALEGLLEEGKEMVHLGMPFKDIRKELEERAVIIHGVGRPWCLCARLAWHFPLASDCTDCYYMEAETEDISGKLGELTLQDIGTVEEEEFGILGNEDDVKEECGCVKRFRFDECVTQKENFLRLDFDFLFAEAKNNAKVRTSSLKEHLVRAGEFDELPPAAKRALVHEHFTKKMFTGERALTAMTISETGLRYVSKMKGEQFRGSTLYLKGKNKRPSQGRGAKKNGDLKKRVHLPECYLDEVRNMFPNEKKVFFSPGISMQESVYWE